MVNKVDTNKRHEDAMEFHALGLGEVWPISSINGHGTGDLLDEVVKDFSNADEAEEPELPRFAVVGRPNVGKSSLINTLTGTDRHIVTDIPGTTRDSIFTRYQQFGFDFVLVDTAGLRRKAKVHEDLEFYSVMRSIRAIENADVCLLMVDASQGFESQDLNIFSLAERTAKVSLSWSISGTSSKNRPKHIYSLRNKSCREQHHSQTSGSFYLCEGKTKGTQSPGRGCGGV